MFTSHRMNFNPIRIREAVLGMGIASMLTLAACAPVPRLGAQPKPLGVESIAAGQSLQPRSAEPLWPDSKWWAAWGDPQLDALIAEGLAGSPDVAAAAARLRRAAALAQEAGASLLPSLDVQGKVGADKQSLNNGFPDQFKTLLPQGWNDSGQISASLSYDLDLWGKNRANLRAARAEARAAAVEAEQARLMLATAIASAYADFARLMDERDVREAEVEVRSASARLVAQREAQGLEHRGNLRQSEALVSSAKADLSAAEEQVLLRRHQLAALVGAGPDRGLTIARPNLPTTMPVPLPADVTTDLVGRRPDVVAARLRVESAAARIKVAKADFYPAIRLSALAGLQSLGVGNLFESDSVYGSVGPAVSLPIFHGGAIQGRYRGARAAYDLAVADYDKTVLTAFQQAADAVTSREQTAKRLVDSRAAREAAEDAYKIAQMRYRGGLSTYLDVLSGEDRLLQTRLVTAQIKAIARGVDIALIRALGGGFDPAKTDGAKVSANE